MRQVVGVYRHRALPLPAKAGDAHSISGLHPLTPVHSSGRCSTILLAPRAGLLVRGILSTHSQVTSRSLLPRAAEPWCLSYVLAGLHVTFLTPAPEALPPPALVQGMPQFMVVYHHRAWPLPATAGDARCTPAVHATALSHPCKRQSTAAARATPSCMRLQPGSSSMAFRAPTAAGPETALPCKPSRALMTAASKGL